MKIENSKKVLIFVNELSYSGVPIYVKNYSEILKGFQFFVWSISDGEFRNEFEKIGIPVEIFSNTEIMEVYLQEKKSEFDACIVHSAFSYRYYEILKKNIPTSWYIHEGKLLQQICNENKALRMVLSNAENLVCVSEYVSKIVKAVSQNYENFVINNIISLKNENVKWKKTNSEKIRFIQLGTIEYRKGYDILLDAIDMFDELEKEKFSVKIAGRVMPFDLDYAKNIIKRANSMKNVEYMGYLQDFESVEDFYNENDVLIVSSRDEASSLTALEAAAHSIPLILSDSVGAGYLCENCSELFKTGNAYELHDYMKSYIRDKEQINKIGKNVFENYKKYANESEYVNKNIQVINMLLNYKINDFKTSVIIEVKDGDVYFAETLRSIFIQNQTKEIQIIIAVNSNTKCEINKLQEKYQHCATILPVEECLANIKGEFFTICEEGTVFEAEYFEKTDVFFNNNKEIDIVVSSLFAENNKTLLQNIFYEKERIIDILKNPEIVITHTNSIFYRKSAIACFGEFDGSWDYDLRNAYATLITKKKFAIIGEAENSNVYILKNEFLVNRNIYETERLRKTYVSIINYSVVQNGNVIKAVQYFLSHAIRDKLFEKNYISEFLSEEDDIDLNKEILSYIMSFIDDGIIYSFPRLSLEQKIFWLRKKYGENTLSVENEGFEFEILHDAKRTGIKYAPLVEYQFAKMDHTTIKIEGYITFPIPEKMGNATVIFSNNEKTYLADIKKDNMPEYVWGDEVICQKLFFCVEISLETEESMQLECNVMLEGLNALIKCKRYRFGRFFPVSDKYKKQYFYSYGNVLTTKNSLLVVEKCEQNKLYKIEHEYELEIKNKEIQGLRSLYYAQNKNLPIWLIWDRDCAARDNGEALFRYLVQNEQETLECYFVIKENSDDYIRLRNEFVNVVAVGSEIHKRLFIQADRIIGSQTDSVMWPLNSELCRDIISQKKFVFLQHGITKNDMSKNYARYWQNIQLFVAAAKPEYECTKKIANYGFERNMVQLLGFPRYDLLEKNEKKIIAIIPTWRKYCVDKSANGAYSLKTDFASLDYFTKYFDLLNNHYLRELAEKFDYKIILMQHSIMKTSDSYFNGINCLTLANESITYKDITSDASIIISDYSSVAFDFAYLEKPVIYYQFDREKFYATHTYQEGYFEYERDGFGDVLDTASSVVNKIEYYLENNCKIEEKYKKRSEEFFGFRDKYNCQRVTKAIKEMDK